MDNMFSGFMDGWRNDIGNPIICIAIITIIMIACVLLFGTDNLIKTGLYFLVGVAAVIIFHDKKIRDNYLVDKQERLNREVIKTTTGLGEHDILNIFNRI